MASEDRIKELIAEAVKDGGPIHDAIVKGLASALQGSGAGPTSAKPPREAQARATEEGKQGMARRPVVLSPPSLSGMANALRKQLNCEEFSEAQGRTLYLDKFPSGDLNGKYNWERVVGRKVIMLFDTVDKEIFFDQLCVLQALQGFAVPHPSDTATQWKTYVDRGKYWWGRAAKITVVLPWYRPCQMERTSRWQLNTDSDDPKQLWSNSNPNGQWLDMPSALYYARLLATPGSVPPLPGPADVLDGMDKERDHFWRPPLELVFVELHEEAPVSQAVSDLNATIRMERFVPYFLHKYESKEMQNEYPGPDRMYVLFPDYGAYKRYAESARDALKLDIDHLLYIEKTRVGASTKQENKIFYGAKGAGQGEKTEFSSSDQFLIIDDFTNSGGTLIGAVNIVKAMIKGSGAPKIDIFVSHLVALYDEKKLNELKKKMNDLGKNCKLYCTNSIPMTTNIVRDWKDEQFVVVDLSNFIGELVTKKDNDEEQRRSML